MADKMVGTYVGEYHYQNILIPDFSINVSKVSENEINIYPRDGATSSNFIATLDQKTIQGSSIIFIRTPNDMLDINGSFIESSGRLTYNLHLGGPDKKNIETFAGIKK